MVLSTARRAQDATHPREDRSERVGARKEGAKDSPTAPKGKERMPIGINTNGIGAIW